jgi:alanyl-tRNA synthetase
VRAGGKHNDLDNVGYTARHLTFFEMLGNFSFGDYFKEQAIEHAWTLVTRDFQLPKDKLLVTVYHDDDEAHGLWKKIAGLPDSRIIRIPTNDNFWMMGDTGPCGPCSEIFIDRGDHIWGGPPGSPGQDGDRFLEFWNLVFMQYEQFNDGRPACLPAQAVDRHWHGPRAHLGDHAGRRLGVRDRPVREPHLGRRRALQGESRGRTDRFLPRHRRSPALGLLPHC